jgi:glycosyltransferase involved in cell wall biosynthesis
VQHRREEWFDTDDNNAIHEYLFSAPSLFWNGIKKMMEYRPSLSGYTTTYNALSQDYPFVQSIRSMLAFCDEVCVVDGGSNDGTWEKLLDIVMEPKGIKLKDLNDIEKESTVNLSKDGAVGEFADGKKIRIMQVSRDWNHPRFAVFDGMQKAEARSMCTSEYCWQMDCDEVVHEEDGEKVIELCRKFPANVDIISLPVVEYWGGSEKVRADIMPWKWRLSRNKKQITHGIPADARRFDENGELFAAYGDGCDMIDSDTHERIPHVTFYTQEIDTIRQSAVSGDVESIKKYEEWFNKVVDNLPGVFHYSWFDIERKMHLYKNYWTKHWESLSGKKYEDTAESNMMFDVPWSQVTSEMIKSRAAELAQELGGWIWHKKWDGKTKTHHIKVNKTQPKLMLGENE